MEMALSRQDIYLFLGTFVSASLLVLGLAMLGVVFFPALASSLAPAIVYTPQLPLSAERDEEFIDITKDPGRQLFPPLSSVEDLTPGNWIRIPSIGVKVPLALSPTMNDADVIKTLELGAALYPNGIAPGRLGNVFISAHSTGEPWKGAYRFAFLNIDQVTEDNLIHLDYQGTRYTYRVSGSELVKPHPDYRVISDRPVPTVTIMACWPLWTTSQRMLVRAELVNVTPLTVVAGAVQS